MNLLLIALASQNIADATSSQDRRALETIQQGFSTLIESNPDLANKLMVDVLAGFREWVRTVSLVPHTSLTVCYRYCLPAATAQFGPTSPVAHATATLSPTCAIPSVATLA